jgi:hypothetical protein
VDDHRRGRRLAVGAGDGDRRLQAGQLAEQVGAVQLGGARGSLGVVGRDRGGVDDGRAGRDVARVVAVERAVGAGHLGAEDARDLGQAAHADALDADEVEFAS